MIGFLNLQNEFDNLSDGIDAIAKGHIWGILHFSENYTRSVFERINRGQDAGDDIVDWANVDITMDMSSR